MDLLGAIGSMFVTNPTTSSSANLPEPKKFKPSQGYMKKYVGSHAIVTGGSSEIGRKVSRKLMKAGIAKLVICCRDTRGDIGFKTENAIALANGNPMTSVAVIEYFDFKNPEDIEKKFATIIKTHLDGKLHHMFLCH